MTKEESLAYRRECPYDAIGDFSALFEKDQKSGENKTSGVSLPDISEKQVK